MWKAFIDVGIGVAIAVGVGFLGKFGIIPIWSVPLIIFGEIIGIVAVVNIFFSPKDDMGGISM